MYLYMTYTYSTCTLICTHMKQFWFVCIMCQTYWAHVFLIGCARHPVTACNQPELGSNVQLPTSFPTLVALLPTLAPSAVLVCTHWHVRVPMLGNCGANNVFEPLVSQTNMLTQQVFEPLVDHDF